MIGFTRLERKGNLGNQLFQIASIMGIAIKNNTEFLFPKWKYAEYFKNQLPVFENDKNYNFVDIQEINSTYQIFQLDASKNHNIEGWLQSEKYFDIDKAKFFFQFKDEKIDEIKLKYKKQFLKKTILISIRRGDFVDHPDFYQLSIKYYINALVNYFPDWKNHTVFIFSDDVNYSKFHFGDFENCYFNDNMVVMDQLMIASLCNHFIISNSTFSWWCAWLGEKSDSIVIRPSNYFSENKRKINDDVDYFPDRWTCYCHEKTKLKVDINRLLFTKNEMLIDYYNNYFEFNSLSYLDSIQIFDTIIPPLPLYDILKRNKNYKLSYANSSYINSKKEYDLFRKQLDFGYFSIIFKFKKSKIKKLACIISFNNNEKQIEAVLNIVGSVNDLKGGTFLILRLKRKMWFETKKLIKKALPEKLVKYIKS